MSQTVREESRVEQPTFETISTRRELSVLFAEILAPPRSLLGPERVRDLVSLIQQAEGDNTVQVLVFKSGNPGVLDPDGFPRHIEETRRYIRDFDAADAATTAAIGLYEKMLASHPNRVIQLRFGQLPRR
jgi:hypothetical protein